MRLALLWAFGSSCIDTLSDGLFLEFVGASLLPRVYLAIALGMIGVSTIVLYALKAASPYRILTVAMSVGVCLCLAASLFLLGTPPEWFWYGLKIASRMFFAVMIAVSWTFIDQYHDLQDAKRVYSLYSGAYFAGTILSGTLINLLLHKVGFSGLMILAAASIVGGILEARGIARFAKPVQDDSVEGVFSGSRDSFSSVVKLIARSRFAIVLLLLSLFTQLLITVTEFNYMDSFGAHFTAGPMPQGQIAEFLGKCRAWISLCNILSSLFLYSRFVRRSGLQNVILVTPLFFVAVYAGWVVQDSLLLAILGLIAVDGILFTVEDNCFNLLSNAVPSKLKSRVRIVNDSFFEPIGMLVSALLLFSLQESSRWLGLLLGVVMLILTLVLRSLYQGAIFSNLKDNAMHFERSLKQWLGALSRREQKEAKREISQALVSGPEETRLLAVEAMLHLEDGLPQILQTAEGLGTVSKIQVLRLLEASPFANDSRVIEVIDSWAQTAESPELAKWANFYLAKKGLHHPEKVEDDLDHSDLMLRGAAILTLKKSLANPTLEYAALNRAIASKKLDLMLKSSRFDEISMALDILTEDSHPEGAERALPFLSHESTLVKRSAARCIAKLADKRFSRHAPRLIEELSAARDHGFRLHLIDALGAIADTTTLKDLLLASVHFRPNERRRTEAVIVQMGLKTVPLLLTLTKDPALPERARILAGKILSRLALPQLQANLIDILDVEIERAYFYFYFAHTIQNQHPLYDLKMLRGALLAGYQSVIDFIIHLLGTAGSLEDPEYLVRALHSANEKVHSHAVESLERTCDVRIFRLIAPLIDDLPLEEKMKACLRWQGSYPHLTLAELLDKLEHSPALFDKIVANRLKAELKMPGWRQSLRDQMKRSGETFHQFAYELLDETS
jgi:hypothetical protein